LSIYIREKQLSPEALKALAEAPNKSMFVREAVEFYVHHGKDILKELKEIKELMNSVLDLNTLKELQTTRTVDRIPVQDVSKNEAVINELKNKMPKRETQENVVQKSEIVQGAKPTSKPESTKNIEDERKKEIEKQLVRSISLWL